MMEAIPNVGKGEPKNLIPWDKLADFFNKNLK